MAKATAVFIHGIFSSASSWDEMVNLLTEDQDIASKYDFKRFSYDSRRFVLDPRRRLPSFNDLAESLGGYLDTLGGAQRIALLTHSQGGLIAQRYLASMLSNGQAHRLSRIRQIVMFACPNNGSEAFILVRRWSWFWRHPQERQLRPLTEEVMEAQGRVLRGIVFATEVTTTSCPIPLIAYAGDADNIVIPISARSVWPHVGTIPGDHSSVIRPKDREDRSYVIAKSHLLKALVEPFPKRDEFDLDALAASEERRALTQLRQFPYVGIRLNGREVRFQVHCGPIEQLASVDIVVLSSNTYLEMSQFFKPSVSGRLRRAGAKKGAAGEIVEDTVYDEIVHWLRQKTRYGLPVEAGTVASTSAGELASRGIRRFYHAAIAEPVAETDRYQVNPHSVSRAVHNCFQLARAEITATPQVGGTSRGRSICFPLLGAGRGGLSGVTSLAWMWPALTKELSTDPFWDVHLITWRPEHAQEVHDFLLREARSDGSSKDG